MDVAFYERKRHSMEENYRGEVWHDGTSMFWLGLMVKGCGKRFAQERKNFRNVLIGELEMGRGLDIGMTFGLKVEH